MVFHYEIYPKQYQDLSKGVIAIKDWIQKYMPESLFFKRKEVSEFIIDETHLKVVQKSFGCELLL